MEAAAQTFLISRTDAIGDVILTLPVCGWLKKNVPGCRIVFLGKTYTKPVVACCPHVDDFLNRDELLKLPKEEQVQKLQSLHIDTIIHVFPDKEIALLAKEAGVKNRIGTQNRWFHWLSCNKLVALSRKNSTLHESQLNLKLLEPVGLENIPDLSEIKNLYRLIPSEPLSEEAKSWLETGKRHIILHPKSQGSAREWGLENFGNLAKALHAQGCQVFISGTPSDKENLGNWLEEHKPYITDLTGKLSLPQFISFISACDGLVAASTGPLHIAAGVGVNALGIYPPLKPIHPGRWAPIGPKAGYIVLEKECVACKGNPKSCVCINDISIPQVMHRIEQWFIG